VAIHSERQQVPLAIHNQLHAPEEIFWTKRFFCNYCVKIVKLLIQSPAGWGCCTRRCSAGCWWWRYSRFTRPLSRNL